MCWHTEHVFAATRNAPGQARAFALGELGQLVAATDQKTLDDVRLILSELVSNAVQAGSATVTTSLDLHRDSLRIAVTDDAPGRPVIQSHSMNESRGRGLQIVGILTSSWGVAEVSSGGKQVWAVLPVHDCLTTKQTCSL